MVYLFTFKTYKLDKLSESDSLLDNDNSFDTGKIVITDSNNSEIYSEIVKRGKNEHIFSINPSNSYEASISYNYNKIVDKVDNSEDRKENVITTFKILDTSYNLQLTPGPGGSGSFRYNVFACTNKTATSFSAHSEADESQVLYCHDIIILISGQV